MFRCRNNGVYLFHSLSPLSYVDSKTQLWPLDKSFVGKPAAVSGLADKTVHLFWGGGGLFSEQSTGYGGSDRPDGGLS